eukprot:g46130.t1
MIGARKQFCKPGKRQPLHSKKKWQIELEEAEKKDKKQQGNKEEFSDKVLTINSLQEEVVACSECQGSAGEAVLFCKVCKNYFCSSCFISTHRPKEQAAFDEERNARLLELQASWTRADENEEALRHEHALKEQQDEHAEAEALERCRHPGSLFKGITKDSFNPETAHPAALVNLVAAREKKREKTEAKQAKARFQQEKDKRDQKQKEERSAQEKKEVLKLLASLSQRHVHRFRLLLGTQNFETNNLGAGWQDGKPAAQIELEYLRNSKTEEIQPSPDKEKAERELAGDRAAANGDSPAETKESETNKIAQNTVAKVHKATDSGDSNVVSFRSVLVTHGATDLREEDERQQLKKLFLPYGEVVDVQCKQRGCAVVEFKEAKAASAALAATTPMTFHSRPVHLNLWDPEGLHRSQQEEEETAPGTKWKLCRMHRQMGWCKKADQCPLAHHPRELRPEIKERLFRPKANLHRHQRQSRSRSPCRHKRRSRSPSHKKQRKKRSRSRSRRKQSRSSSRTRKSSRKKSPTKKSRSNSKTRNASKDRSAKPSDGNRNKKSLKKRSSSRTRKESNHNSSRTNKRGSSADRERSSAKRHKITNQVSSSSSSSSSSSNSLPFIHPSRLALISSSSSYSVKKDIHRSVKGL